LRDLRLPTPYRNPSEEDGRASIHLLRSTVSYETQTRIYCERMFR
jgi:hypothetical protein